MMKTVLLILILLASPLLGQTEEEKSAIGFPGFSWGLSVPNVKTKAQNLNFSLEDEELGEIERYLEFELDFMGHPAIANFLFTPKSDELYCVRINWEKQDAPKDLEKVLQRKLGIPREKMNLLGITIWNRELTEVELRQDDEDITLIYGDMELWEEAKKQKKNLRQLDSHED